MKRLLLLAALAVTLCAAPALARTTVKVAHATWVGYGPLYIAKEKGFFDKYDLDVELLIIEDESQYAAALASGNIDGLGNVLDREVIHFAKGTDEVVLFAMDESTGGDGIVAGPGIQTLADLKGRTIGLDKSSTSYFFFLTALHAAGVEEAGVNIMEMGASDAGAAFVAGRLDAAVTWEPWLTNAGQREGGHVLVDSSDYPRTIVDVFVLRKAFAEAHPEAPVGLTKAWFEAVEWYAAHPDQGNAIMGKAMGLPASDMAAMASGVTFFDKAGNLDFFDRNAANNIFEVAQRAGSFWQAKGILSRPLDVDALVTDQYVQAAAR
ncbi:MAG: ABC transporter substrate-binding protein [Desulfovibrio sp.]|jgi:NitT/TauT family transport system substrate-binding protein